MRRKVVGSVFLLFTGEVAYPTLIWFRAWLQIPCSGDLLANSGMPLAVMVQPLALQDPAEEAIQVVDGLGS